MKKKKGESEVIDFEAEKKRLLEETSTDDSIEASIFDDEIKLTELNKKHAFINSVGGRPMVLCYVYSEVFDREIIEFQTPGDIEVRYSNQFMPDSKGLKTVPLGKWWKIHPYRREYETVTFEPHKPSGEYTNDKTGLKYFNLWEGFSVEPKKGTWQRTIKHIYTVLCNKDKDKFKYTLKWITWAIQNPGQRAEVAIVFKGKKGAGKGFIFTQLSEIFGKHGMSISNRKHLTGQFNGHLERICFLFADEAYYPGDKEVEGTLKQIITEPRLTVEPKFMNTKLGINCLHIGMSTNADWVVPASMDERRYFINAVDNRYAMGQCPNIVRKEYFDALWKEMKEGGQAAMLYDLQTADLKGWHPRDNIPETDELNKQVHSSLTRYEKAVFALLDNGVFPGYVNMGEYKVGTKELLEYMKEIEPDTAGMAMRSIGEVLKKLGCENTRTAEKRVWQFPPLPDMKKIWSEQLSRHRWDDYADWIVQKANY